MIRCFFDEDISVKNDVGERGNEKCMASQPNRVAKRSDATGRIFDLVLPDPPPPPRPRVSASSGVLPLP